MRRRGGPQGFAWVIALAAASHAACGAQQPEWIAPGESIVVLESPQFYFDWDHRRLPLNIDLFRCATQGVHDKYPGVRLVSQREFVSHAFPDLEPAAAPVSPESMKLLMDNATLQQRIAPLHVRYLVYGGTQNDIETVTKMFWCVGAGGAGFCGANAEWHKESGYHLLIVDLSQQRESRAEHVVSGNSWFVAVLPLFIGWKAPTEAHACKDLGEDVLALLEGGSAPGGQEARQ